MSLFSEVRRRNVFKIALLYFKYTAVVIADRALIRALDSLVAVFLGLSKVSAEDITDAQVG